MRSMTGYGRGVSQADGRALTVELKSVNHRFLDLSFRLPPALWALEGTLRGMLTNALGRGHVDVTARLADGGAAGDSVWLNLPLARAHAEAWRTLADETGLKRMPGIRELAAVPGVLTPQNAEEDFDALTLAATKAMAQALETLVSDREREGDALKAQLRACAHTLADLRARMQEAAREQPRLCRERLEARLNELRLEGVDPQRLLQEAALLADRCAVDEEIARLQAHLKQLTALLEAQDPVGRRLDFLLQEMHREVNTIGSKSADITLTQLMLAAKNELEKLREQAQNIE